MNLYGQSLCHRQSASFGVDRVTIGEADAALIRHQRILQNIENICRIDVSRVAIGQWYGNKLVHGVPPLLLKTGG